MQGDHDGILAPVHLVGEPGAVDVELLVRHAAKGMTALPSDIGEHDDPAALPEAQHLLLSLRARVRSGPATAREGLRRIRAPLETGGRGRCGQVSTPSVCSCSSWVCCSWP